VQLLREDRATQIAAALTLAIFVTRDGFFRGFGKSTAEHSLDKRRSQIHLALWHYPRHGSVVMKQARFIATGVMLSCWAHVVSVQMFNFKQGVALQIAVAIFLAWVSTLAFIMWENYQVDKKKRGKIPVTVVTGFLGAGKTTMIQHVLRQQTEAKILVVENEVGAVGVDHELLVKDSKEEIVLLRNGCVCCSVRADFTRVLKEQIARDGAPFDAIILETTGIAKPAPIIQSFFADKEVVKTAKLDAVLAVVDAVHLWKHVTLARGGQAAGKAKKGEVTQLEGGQEEVVEQIAYADRVIINKADLVTEEELIKVGVVVKSLNSGAEVLRAVKGQLPISELLNLRAFDLQNKAAVPSLQVVGTHDSNRTMKQRKATFNLLDIKRGEAVMFGEDGKLRLASEVHRSMVDTFVVSELGSVHIDQFNEWIAKFLQEHGERIYRMKGFVSVQGENHKLVFQAIHMSFTGERGELWERSDKRKCTLIMIGKNLPSLEARLGLQRCMIKAPLPTFAQ